MSLRVEPSGQDHSLVTVGVERAGGKTLSWGSGKAEVAKIFRDMEQELDKVKANPAALTH